MNSLVAVVVFACLASSVFSAYVGPYQGHGIVQYSGTYGTSYAEPLASPVVLPSGYLADTPEVAALKGVHAAALINAGAAAGAAPAEGYYRAAGARYAGQLAVPVVQSSRYLAYTPEVASLRVANFIALSKAAVAYPGEAYYGVVGARYAGPQAIPAVLPSGYLADTPEVASLKGAHSVALVKVGAAAAASPDYGYGYGYGYYQ